MKGRTDEKQQLKQKNKIERHKILWRTLWPPVRRARRENGGGMETGEVSCDWHVVPRLMFVQLQHDRTYLGCPMGSLEAWLLLRSLKTLHLRIPRQSENATALVKWLDSVRKTPKGETFEGIPGGLISVVHHSSLQGTDARGFNPKNQMLGGFNAVFGIEVSEVIRWSLSDSCDKDLFCISSLAVNWPHDFHTCFNSLWSVLVEIQIHYHSILNSFLACNEPWWCRVTRGA